GMVQGRGRTDSARPDYRLPTIDYRLSTTDYRLERPPRADVHLTRRDDGARRAEQDRRGDPGDGRARIPVLRGRDRAGVERVENLGVDANPIAAGQRDNLLEAQIDDAFSLIAPRSAGLEHRPAVAAGLARQSQR